MIMYIYRLGKGGAFCVLLPLLSFASLTGLGGFTDCFLFFFFINNIPYIKIR